MIFLTNKNGWPSEFTRGRQIADALGARVDGEIKSWDETIIMVKAVPDPKVVRKMKNSYLDLIDDANTVRIACRYPTATVIALTELHKSQLEKKIPNKIIVIPEHTCNFEHRIRTRIQVKRVGYIGSPECFDLNPDVLGDALNKAGLEFFFMPCTGKNTTRKDVCDFYMSIDIQIAFRTPQHDIRVPEFRNPLKIFNAGSFKIPTVAYPEVSYSFCAGSYFLDAVDPSTLIDRCWRLAVDKELYHFYSERVFEWSKQFDIAKVAKLYAQLSPGEKFDIKRNIERMKYAGAKVSKQSCKKAI